MAFLINPSIVWTVPSMGANCKLLLHMDGTDGSTTFTDSSGLGKTPLSVSGNAQIDTAQSVFGGASGVWDGSGDRVQYASHADWSFGTGDFTVDFWLRLPSFTGTFNQLLNVNSGFQISINATTKYLDVGINGVATVISYLWSSVALNTWYHIAATRSGNNWYLFIDGVLVATGTNSSSLAQNALSIGSSSNASPSSVLTGWMDEIRWVKGTCDWTSDFTPPKLAYV